MEQKRLRQAQELFEVPEEFYEVSCQMVHDVEWELILAMDKRTIPYEELKKLVEKERLAADAADFIRECYSRAILKKVIAEDGSLSYMATNFYARYPYYTQYEYYEYGKLPREMKERLNEWDRAVYVSIYKDDVEKKKQGIETWIHNSTFLTLAEANAVLEQHPEHITLHACNCKTMMYYHDRPLQGCMHLFDWPNSESDRGHGECLTLEEAKVKLKEFNKKGLMQNGEEGGFCNCDGYCCYPLHMARTLGSKGFYPKSNYQIDWHEDECINCGKCTTICNFGAFYKDENKKVHYNPDLCWGCTICSPNCPKGAIHLIPKEENENS